MDYGYLRDLPLPELMLIHDEAKAIAEERKIESDRMKRR